MSKKAFISYSHEDKAFVETLVNELNKEGVPQFFDQWDIMPGDSLVRKIFEEGLRDADLFLVVLSRASVTSKWVSEELDAATVRRIEGVIKVIPILIDDCEIPISLRALMWLDMRQDFAGGIHQLVNIANGVTDRPPLGPTPERISALVESSGGLTKLATTVGFYLLEASRDDAASQRMWTGGEICSTLKMSPQDVNDAIEELKDRGLVTTIDFCGSAPFKFGQAAPTYALFLQMKQALQYDPQEDIKILAATVAAMGEINGSTAATHTGLSPARLNRAARYLEDYGLVTNTPFLGTAPYSFGHLKATRHTRRFLQ